MIRLGIAAFVDQVDAVTEALVLAKAPSGIDVFFQVAPLA
jgi:hypothetical protein